MADTDQSIRPALTPKEWSAYLAEITPEDRARGDANHFSMALSNAILPDDDPRKITRADIEALESVGQINPDDLPGYGVPIFALMRKLAALLPPE